jgi:hypothetical protein
MMLTLLLAASVSQPKLVPAFGFASVKCEEAFRQEAAAQSESWILGFWTGLNLQSAASVGAGKSTDAVLDSVKAACANQPSVTLLKATQLAYRAMKNP